MKKNILLLFIMLVWINYSKNKEPEIIYLVTRQVTDLNDQLFSRVNLANKKCIWNSAWKPNMWFLTRKLIQAKSNYILKTPSTNHLPDLLEELKEAKWVIDYTDESQFTLSLTDSEDWLLKKMIIMLWEPPVINEKIWSKDLHNKLALVFTWDDSIIDQEKYFLFRWPTYSGFKLNKTIPFEKRTLCCLINANKTSQHENSLYHKRLEDILFFEEAHSDDFNFYGVGWPIYTYKNYRGQIPEQSKKKYQSKYKFCLCYENMQNVHGYVTEKIFNCLEAGCVPIYWGVDNITQFIPQNCFIDRRQFKDMSELYQFLKSVNKKQYDQYLQNIKQYLNSSKPYEFTVQCFAEHITTGILDL